MASRCLELKSNESIDDSTCECCSVVLSAQGAEVTRSAATNSAPTCRYCCCSSKATILPVISCCACVAVEERSSTRCRNWWSINKVSGIRNNRTPVIRHWWMFLLLRRRQLGVGTTSRKCRCSWSRDRPGSLWSGTRTAICSALRRATAQRARRRMWGDCRGQRTPGVLLHEWRFATTSSIWWSLHSIGGSKSSHRWYVSSFVNTLWRYVATSRVGSGGISSWQTATSVAHCWGLLQGATGESVCVDRLCRRWLVKFGITWVRW